MNKYEEAMKIIIENDLCVDYYCGMISTPDNSEYYFNTQSFDDFIDSLKIVVDDLNRETSDE